MKKEELFIFFKSVLDQDQAAVVLCDLNHTIIYMNPFAINRYHADLTGKSLMECHNPSSRQLIEKVIEWFKKSPDNNQIYESYNDKENKDVYMVALRDENKKLIGYYEKHEYRNRETDSFYNGIEK